MTVKKQKVVDLIDHAIQTNYSTIITNLLINMNQDFIEGDNDLLDPVLEEEVDGLVECIKALIEVYNPEFKDAISFLEDFLKALEEWRDEIQFINNCLN